jgi:hypothetical protein
MLEGDWPVHKILCKTLKDFQMPPSPDHYRAIVFDERGPKPTFTWLKVTQTGYKTEEGDVLQFNSEHWPGNGVPGLRFTQELEFNEVLQRAHVPINGLGCAPPAEKTGGAIALIGPPNKSLLKVDREFHNGFGGPLFYYSSEHHLDTMSFRHIIDALFISRGHSWRAYANAHPAPGQVPAVLVNCLGDKQVFKRARTEAYRVPADFYECKFLRSIPVAERIGIPMVFYPIAHEAAWLGRTHGNFPYDMNPQPILISPLDWECT